MSPSYSSSKSKGKSKDQSTQWSDWVLDNQNRYYRWRINPSGLEERYYDYVEPDDIIPRTLGTDAQESYSTNTTSSNSITSANYTTSYNTLASQQSYSYDLSQSTDLSSPQKSYYNQDTISGNFSDTAGTHDISASEHNYYSATNTQNDSGYDDGSSSQFRQRHGSNLKTITQGIEAVEFQEQDHLSPKIPTPKKIYATKHRTKLERLSNKYQTIPDKDQKKFWRQGRVFMMLWSEPAANPNPTKVPEDGGSRDGSHISTTWLEGRVYSEIRRFVVVREGYGNHVCCPIQTYSGQATLKPGLLDPQQHAIIYTSSEPPGPHSITRDGVRYTEQLTKPPIKVTRFERGPEGDLGTLSRLNYSKLYTVENYVRVLNIGMVHKDWLAILDVNSLVSSTREEPVGRPREDIRKNSSERSHKHSQGSVERMEYGKLNSQILPDLPSQKPNMRRPSQSTGTTYDANSSQSPEEPRISSLSVTPTKIVDRADDRDFSTQRSPRRTKSMISSSSVSDVEASVWSSTSRSSISSLVDQPGWQDRLINLLSSDSQLQVLFIAALRKVSPERFQDNVKKCIRKLSMNLRSEAQTPVQRKVAKAIVQFSGNVAYQIRRNVEKNIGFVPTTSIIPHLEEDNDGSSTSDLEVFDEALDLTDDAEAFIHNSHAFEVLRESFNLFVNPDSSRKALFKIWPTDLQWAKKCDIIYQLSWNGASFLKSHFTEGQRLGQVITLTGDIFDAQAASCQDYICNNWPEIGGFLLEALGEFLVTFHDVIIKRESAEIRVVKQEPTLSSTQEPVISLTLGASYETQILAARALSWLCSAVRSSPYPGVSVSSTNLHASRENNESRIIHLKQGYLEEVYAPKSCWHVLFPYGVIAQGFPIPERNEGRGLEISFADMALCSNSLSLVEYDGGLVVEGLNSILVPIAELESDKALQWHYETKRGKRPCRQARVSQLLNSRDIPHWYRQLQPEILINRRAFLGWVDEAHIIIGSESYSHINPRPSGARPPGTYKAKSFSLSFGTGGMGTGSAAIGITLTPTSVVSRISSPIEKDLYDTLATCQTELVLIYDVDACICWLLPKASFVLFAVQTIIKRRQYKLIGDNDHEVSLGFTEPSFDGIAESVKLLKKAATLKIRKDTEKEDESLSKTVRQTWHLLQTAGTRLENTVQELKSSGQKAPRRLYGVEFDDVVNTTDLSIKTVEVNQPWAHLAVQEPTVIFCRNFGQPIVPTTEAQICKPWLAVPKKKNYLVASAASISILLEDQEGDDGAQLSQNVHWNYDNILVQLHRRGSNSPIAHTQNLCAITKPDKKIRRKVARYINACFIFTDSKVRKKCPETLYAPSWATSRTLTGKRCQHRSGNNSVLLLNNGDSKSAGPSKPWYTETSVENLNPLSSYDFAASSEGITASVSVVAKIGTGGKGTDTHSVQPKGNFTEPNEGNAYENFTYEQSIRRKGKELEVPTRDKHEQGSYTISNGQSTSPRSQLYPPALEYGSALAEDTQINAQVPDNEESEDYNAASICYRPDRVTTSDRKGS